MPKLSRSKQKHRDKMFDDGFQRCSKCKTFLPISDFWKNKRKPYGLQPHCKNCHKEYRESKKLDITSYWKQKDTPLKKNLASQLGGICQRCGYDEFLSGLEFHHVDPDKKRKRVTNDISSGHSSGAYAEIDKCVLLCSCCHNSHRAGAWDAKFEKAEFGWRLVRHWLEENP